jgi:hypothetical protein
MKISHAKISFFLFAIILIAGFYAVSSAQENSTSDKNIFVDSDQDGLSDDEEKTYNTNPSNRDTDGDGYSDGTEIKGGYDPLKPAPGDKIINDTKPLTTSNSQTEGEGENLTDEVSLEIANLVSERSAEQQDITLDDLDTIIEKSTGNSLTFEDLPKIDDDEIKIMEQNYSKLSDEKRAQKEKDDALEYLVAVSYIMANNSPQEISQVSDLDAIAGQVISQVSLVSDSFSNLGYFQDLATKGASVLEELKEVEVPENMIGIHKKGLQLAKYSTTLESEFQPSKEDPVGTIAGLGKVQSLISLTIEFSSEISDKFVSLGIDEIPLEL